MPKRKPQKASKPAPPAPAKQPAPAKPIAVELTAADAEKILDADFKNLLKKVAQGKTLTAADRAIVTARASKRPVADPALTKPHCTDKTELAEILGVSRQAVNLWGKLHGAPKPDSAGRHDVAAWIRFRNDRGLKGSELSSNSHAEEMNAVELATAKEKLAILQREHTPNEVFVKILRSIGSRQVQILAQKEKQLPAMLAGKDIPAMLAILRTAFDEVIDQFRSIAAEWNA